MLLCACSPLLIAVSGAQGDGAADTYTPTSSAVKQNKPDFGVNYAVHATFFCLYLSLFPFFLFLSLSLSSLSFSF